MAQSSFPFENVDTTETQFSQMFRTLNAGVNGTPAGTELKVSAGTGLQVSVAAGQAMVRGHYYISTAAELLTISTANATNPRIDSVVLRLDPVANSIVLAVVAGTAAASPVAATLTQTDSGVFEYLLATVLVPAGSGTLSTITDTRTFMGSRLGIWATATRPASPYTGQAGFNSTLGFPEFWNGSLWRAFITSQEVADQAPRGNAIINGDFSINQRNFSSTTSSGYNFDRWLVNLSGGTVTHSSQTFTTGYAPAVGYEGKNYLRAVTSGQSSSSDYAQISQRIESVRTFAGQTVTASFWAKANSGTPKLALELYQYFGTGGSPSAGVPIYGGQVTLSTVWTRYSLTVVVPSIAGKTVGTNGDDHFDFNVFVSAGSTFDSRTGSLGIQNNTFDVWGVQVEAGTVASPFNTATGTKQGELAACQRYYWRFNADSGSTFFGFGAVQYNNNLWDITNFPIRFPVTMRTKPSSTLDSAPTSSFSVNRPGVQAYSVTGMGIDTNTISASGTNVYATHAGVGSYQPVALLATTGSSYLGFSAEL